MSRRKSEDHSITHQHRFHRRLFEALYAWDQTYERILDFTGDASLADRLGLDQLGHFGPSGCDRLVEVIAAWYGSRNDPLQICEIGSGFGGALRYLVRALEQRRVPVNTAVGIELVPEHCRLFVTINRSLGNNRSAPVCASGAVLPLRQESLDAVFLAGSASHLHRMDAVILEAYRTLRPGGLLVFTEEVSLVRDGRSVSPGFLAFHPPTVFSLTTAGERRRQMERAGFSDIQMHDLTKWARDLLRDRIRALTLFQGTAAQTFGSTQTARLLETLEAARREYESGTLQPMLIQAHKA